MLLPCSLDAAAGQAQVARSHLSPSPPSLLPTQEFDILQNRMDGCRHPTPGSGARRADHTPLPVHRIACHEAPSRKRGSLYFLGEWSAHTQWLSDAFDPKGGSEAKLLVALLCPTLCDPLDRSPPGSSVHGILQARTLEWVAISSSRGSSRPRD